MIDADKRNAVYRLHLEGMPQREISRCLRLSRNAVRRIIRQQGQVVRVERTDKTQLDQELLRRLYQECQGYVQRVHERLQDEENIQIPYSTLTRLLRESGIGNPTQPRCERVPDQPGEEMQHDTTLYTLLIGDQKTKVVASALYLRYSKRRYLKFYRTFDRFRMKCFLHEALMFWGYSASQCVIDNTNLARLRGSGSHAVIVPEMEAFASSHSFKFLCHAINHPNRKAGEERSFWTVETNFLPGRCFVTLEDLNHQALHWSSAILDHRPQTKSKLVPAKLFEFEVNYLHRLAQHLPAPYRKHLRDIDQYGYVSFASNFYWIPGSERGSVSVLEYADSIKLFKGCECLLEYPLPPDGVKNTLFTPNGRPPPKQLPTHRVRVAVEEEKRLRSIGPSVGAYLDAILKTKGLQRNTFLRKLHALSGKMTPELFLQTIERAHRYGIHDLEVLQRIASLQLSQHGLLLPSVEINAAFQERETYREGALTERPDLSVYDLPTQQPISENHEQRID